MDHDPNALLADEIEKHRKLREKEKISVGGRREAMNPLTLVKRIQNINSKEAALGVSEEASWHAKYKDSAYVFVGGIPFDLTEGDLLAVFSQYGEIVDVNLVRDKGTGKSKGFAFIAYEDQRSTNLAVDNLNGAQILGRVIRVDHVSNYKKKEEEDEETERQKREARGVCRAFQRGECTRGAGCKFSHDEQRAANTGWGPQDKSPVWGHDKFEGPKKSDKASGSERQYKQKDRMEEKRSNRHDDGDDDVRQELRDDYSRKEERRSRRREDDKVEPKSREDRYKRDEDKLRRHNSNDFQPKSREDDWREEKRSRRHDSDAYLREDQDKRGGDKRSSHGRDSSSYHRRESNDRRHKPDR